MTDKPPEVIYLIPDDNGYVWCEDPAPGVDMEEEDAVVYMRVDAFAEQSCEVVDEVFNNGNYVSVNRFDIKQAIRDKFK